jgi:hypothetical protein
VAPTNAIAGYLGGRSLLGPVAQIEKWVFRAIHAVLPDSIFRMPTNPGLRPGLHTYRPPEKRGDSGVHRLAGDDRCLAQGEVNASAVRGRERNPG